MTTLKKLNAGYSCGIDQDGIQRLYLIELNASNNHKIKNVYFMTSMKKLYINGMCSVDQNGINGLDLTYLEAARNDLIIRSCWIKCFL